jgi:hypothetical protein
MNLLLTMHLEMSARLLCQLCFYAKHAGAVGSVSDFALRPNASSGHYQRKVDSALGVTLRTRVPYTLSVPAYSKHSMRREVRQTPVIIPHEALEAEFRARPTAIAELRCTVEQRDWSQQYWDHPAVRTSSRPIMPLALYLDGVPFLKKDSVLGFWIYSLMTEKRHLVCVLRKRWLCRCGCRGWCSLFPVMSFLRWTFRWAHQGVHPPSDHVGRAWSAGSQRAQLQGTDMTLRYVLLQIKGDWAEFAHTLGFPTWASARNPCCFCHADKAGLYSLRGASLLSLPFPEITPQDYADACARCDSARPRCGFGVGRLGEERLCPNGTALDVSTN